MKNQIGVFVLLLRVSIVSSAHGQAIFAAAVDYDVASQPYSVAIADFNGDRKADLAVVNASANNVSILLGIGDGTFQAAVNYGAGSKPVSVSVGDFNHDGQPDLATANGDSSNVSVLLGSGDGTFRLAVD